MGKYFDFKKIPALMASTMQAFPTTIKLVIVSLIISLILGLIFAVFALSRSRILNAVSKGYVAFMRGMPTLVLIFILYFVVPVYLKKTGIDTNSWSKDSFVIATLSLSAAANMSEMMRSAYQSVSRYQWEAAYSVGMTSLEAFVRIIFPQAFGVAIPNLGNNIIQIFKNTSLAFSIGALDIFGKAKLISNRLYGLNRAELYLGVAAIYWIVCLLLEWVTKRAEKAYTKGRIGNTIEDTKTSRREKANGF
jgi:L-cystine transport system permease protein